MPKVMGIVNVTPDSFSDGGRLRSRPMRRSTMRRSLVEEGADLLDLGGESTRPGSKPVPPGRRAAASCCRSCDELAAEVDRSPLDRYVARPKLPRQALARGASIINDVTALRGDPEMVAVVADAGAGVVLMHMQGVPDDHAGRPAVSTTSSPRSTTSWHERIAWCESRGIPRDADRH